MTDMEIEERVAEILDNIASAAGESGRSGEDITLVAATKMNGAESIRRAIKAGVKVCGENRVQEFLEKRPQGAYEGAQVHFIGHLQRNKAKSVVGEVALIESVGSPELARTVNELAGKRGICQDILVEVNIGKEAGKTGIEPEDLERFMEEISSFSSIRIRGLWALPPAGLERDENRRFFSAMRELFVDIKGKKYDNSLVQFLSMGMSADYMDAIREGANMVRIGTGIFGPRSY